MKTLLLICLIGFGTLFAQDTFTQALPAEGVNVITIRDTVFVDECLCAASVADSAETKENGSRSARIEKMSGGILYVTLVDTLYQNNCDCSAGIEAPSFKDAQDATSGTLYNHTITTNPFLIIGGASLQYALTINNVHTASLYTYLGLFVPATAYTLGAEYTYNFDKIYRDPSFVGVGFAYGVFDGSLDIGKDLYEAELWSGVGTLSIFYGHRYLWDSGFTLSWQIGIGYPVLKEYQWSNSNNTDQGLFESDTQDAEKFIAIGSYLGGCGVDLGWSF